MRRFEKHEDSGRSDRGNFRPRNRSSGDRHNRREGRSGERSSGRGEGRALEFHQATCAKCGEICEVPFRPTGNKPVYCRECFNKDDKRDFAPRGGRFESRSSSNTSSAELDKINKKLDKIMEALDIE